MIAKNKPSSEIEALDPSQIMREIHHRLLILHSLGHDGEVSEIFEKLTHEHPTIAYIYHMELSQHAKGFRSMMQGVLEQGTKIETPLADIGCGPGHMMWWYKKDGIIQPGKVSMVDVDQDALDYAQELLVNRPEAKRTTAKGNEFEFLNTSVTDLARHTSQTGVSYNTIISSLAMQWVGQDLPDKEAKQMRLDACRSIYESLNPSGNFISITEEPPNITATTPLTFFQSGGKDLKFDLGYNNGCPEDEIHEACLNAGFKPSVKDYCLMGVTDDLKAFHDAGLEFDALEKKLDEGKKLSTDEDQRYLDSYWIVRNAHIGTTREYIKPA